MDRHAAIFATKSLAKMLGSIAVVLFLIFYMPVQITLVLAILFAISGFWFALYTMQADINKWKKKL